MSEKSEVEGGETPSLTLVFSKVYGDMSGQGYMVYRVAGSLPSSKIGKLLRKWRI